MPSFRFSLHGLLKLRQLELRQLELHAASEAGQAAVARDQHRRLCEQLQRETPAADEGTQWLVFQQAAGALRQQADEMLYRAQQHEQNHREVETLRVAKQSEVDALELLRDQERDEHVRRQARLGERQADELILRQWRSNRSNSEPTSNDG